MSPNYKVSIIITYTNIPEGMYRTLKIAVTGIHVCEVQLWFTYSFYSHHYVILNCHWQNRIATIINMLTNKVYPVTGGQITLYLLLQTNVLNAHFFNVAQKK